MSAFNAIYIHGLYIVVHTLSCGVFIAVRCMEVVKKSVVVLLLLLFFLLVSLEKRRFAHC